MIITVTRKERFLNAAITQEPLTEAAVTRIEMYLDAIANGSTDVPTPITRVEQYLAKIAGADAEMPTPVTRIEMYLAKVAGMDIEVPTPVTRVEQSLAEWAAEPQGEYKTASGAIVSVTDALPALLKSLIIGITPVQDLHGYDAPWPAGGGKNLFDKDTAVDGYINNLGTAVSSPDAENMTSDFIPVTAGSQYTYTQWPSDVGAGYWIGCGFYAEKDMSTVIGGRQTTNALVGMFTAPEGANYMRIGSRFLKNGKAQLEKGAVSTAYVPYSNICPITGWTGAEVSRTGKNLLDSADFVKGSISGTGEDTQSGNRLRSTFVPIKPSTGYWALCNSEVLVYEFHNYDASRKWLGYSAVSATSGTFTTLSNAAFAKVLIRKSDNASIEVSELTEFILAEGPSVGDYVPYSGTTLPISWQSEAGTVYGGTLDVMSGVLTVDRAIETLDGDEELQSNGIVPYGGIQVVYTPEQTKKLAPTGSTQNEGILSDKFDASISYKPVAFFVTGRSTNGKLYFNMGADVTTAQEAMAWFTDNPTQVSYLLATPTTYQLTPQEVALLRGTNNVWADTGNTELTYYAEVSE